MDYLVTYDPLLSRGFNDESHLRLFLNNIMRTDITQKFTCHLTRGNIYCIRNETGELEYFCNVISVGARMELKRMVIDATKTLPLNNLRNDVAYIEPNIPANQCLECLNDIIEVQLPKAWESCSSVPGNASDFLSSSLCFVLHVDQSYDGENIQYKIHRIYVNN